jgi:hypothetical protein
LSFEGLGDVLEREEEKKKPSAVESKIDSLIQEVRDMRTTIIGQGQKREAGASPTIVAPVSPTVSPNAKAVVPPGYPDINRAIVDELKDFFKSSELKATVKEAVSAAIPLGVQYGAGDMRGKSDPRTSYLAQPGASSYSGVVADLKAMFKAREEKKEEGVTRASILKEEIKGCTSKGKEGGKVGEVGISRVFC